MTWRDPQLPTKDTEAWPPTTKTYTGIVQGASTRTPVVDGCARPEFRPRSAILQARGGTSTPGQTGGVVVEVLGIGGNTSYPRTVSMAIPSALMIDLLPFEDLRVAIVGGTTGATLLCSVSERLAQQVPDRMAFLPETVAVLGERPVPSGASHLIPLAPDAAFSWRAYLATGVAVSVGQPLAAGVRVPVMGSLYVQAAAAQSYLWEIEL